MISFVPRIVLLVGVSVGVAGALGIAGCKGGGASDGKSGKAPPAGTAPAEGSGGAVAAAVEADPPFHTSKPDHSVPRAEPPASPTRDNAPRSVVGKQETVIVSDISMPGGKSTPAVLELRPNGDWKYNTDFPATVTLSGLSLASPPGLKLKSTAPESKGFFKGTSGGLRVDIPFTGDAPGTEQVTAKLRYGLCNASTCIANTATVTFSLTVEDG